MLGEGSNRFVIIKNVDNFGWQLILHDVCHLEWHKALLYMATILKINIFFKLKHMNNKQILRIYKELYINF